LEGYHRKRILSCQNLEEENERLRGALKPFADVATGKVAAGSIMPDSYDAARAAMEGDV
jgi:hypothetical protein